MKRNALAVALFTNVVLISGAASIPAMAQNVPEVKAPITQTVSADQENLNAACTAAKRYIELINDGKFPEIGSLFAEKVDYIGPDAIARSGRAEVAAAYTQMGETYSSQPPKAKLSRLASLNDNECFLEFSLFDYATGAYKLTAVDHFIVGRDGKVIWFRPFFQQALNGLKSPKH